MMNFHKDLGKKAFNFTELAFYLILLTLLLLHFEQPPTEEEWLRFSLSIRKKAVLISSVLIAFIVTVLWKDLGDFPKYEYKFYLVKSFTYVL